ncbi:serine/threonine-protein kinase SIK2-like [Lepus europaeus]|uniref:serine/threonine-protein kinase SIK2-like n=1 Tax=Lepus europaeus TaxID=9983 RepID=UPI002B49F9C3|nr:serine/threonine-protein kinase SIK2-like [Lepus europaeus]
MEGLTAFTSEEEVLDGYQVLRVLGQGGFGLVKLAYHWESRTQVAVKVVENGGQHSCGFQQLCAEAEIMRGLHHPHIIKLLQVRHTAERGYIFMECAVRGDLRGYMVERGYLLDGEIRQLLTQTLLAVHYCHAQHVVHRDLKLENLLLDANLNIKLSDFGLSCKLADGERLRNLCGTFPYCAPEEFLGEEFCGYKADIWSVGVILYAMVAGALPFVGEDFVELQAAILCGYYRIPHYGNPELCNLVDRSPGCETNPEWTLKLIFQAVFNFWRLHGFLLNASWAFILERSNWALRALGPGTGKLRWEAAQALEGHPSPELTTAPSTALSEHHSPQLTTVPTLCSTTAPSSPQPQHCTLRTPRPPSSPRPPHCAPPWPPAHHSPSTALSGHHSP